MQTNPWPTMPILRGKKLTLVPTQSEHIPELAENILHPSQWPYHHWGLKTPRDLEKRFHERMTERDAGKSCMLTMMVESQPVGTSSFLKYSPEHHSIEIGFTTIGAVWQKTFVNTEAKLLMLDYAFTELVCQRVEFRVDALNYNSQRAVLRLGAKCEGELRNLYRRGDNMKCDYKIYSIIDTEWKNVKSTLEWRRDVRS